MTQQPPPVSALASGLNCRCPACGEGPLFSGAFTLDLHERCDRCGLSYRFIDSGDGPDVFVIMILGFVLLGSALLLEFTVHPPIWVHAAVWIPATLALAFGMLRPLKAWLIAMQYKHKAEQGRFVE